MGGPQVGRPPSSPAQLDSTALGLGLVGHPVITVVILWPEGASVLMPRSSGAWLSVPCPCRAHLYQQMKVKQKCPVWQFEEETVAVTTSGSHQALSLHWSPGATISASHTAVLAPITGLWAFYLGSR